MVSVQPQPSNAAIIRAGMALSQQHTLPEQSCLHPGITRPAQPHEDQRHWCYIRGGLPDGSHSASAAKLERNPTYDVQAASIFGV